MRSLWSKRRSLRNAKRKGREPRLVAVQEKELEDLCARLVVDHEKELKDTHKEFQFQSDALCKKAFQKGVSLMKEKLGKCR